MSAGGWKVHPHGVLSLCSDNGTAAPRVQDDDGVNEIIAGRIEADGIVPAAWCTTAALRAVRKCARPSDSWRQPRR